MSGTTDEPMSRIPQAYEVERALARGGYKLTDHQFAAIMVAPALKWESPGNFMGRWQAQLDGMEGLTRTLFPSAYPFDPEDAYIDGEPFASDDTSQTEDDASQMEDCSWFEWLPCDVGEAAIRRALDNYACVITAPTEAKVCPTTTEAEVYPIIPSPANPRLTTLFRECFNWSATKFLFPDDLDGDNVNHFAPDWTTWVGNKAWNMLSLHKDLGPLWELGLFGLEYLSDSPTAENPSESVVTVRLRLPHIVARGEMQRVRSSAQRLDRPSAILGLINRTPAVPEGLRLYLQETHGIFKLKVPIEDAPKMRIALIVRWTATQIAALAGPSVDSNADIDVGLIFWSLLEPTDKATRALDEPLSALSLRDTNVQPNSFLKPGPSFAHAEVSAAAGKRTYASVLKNKL